jgi:hypothetical protein
MRNASSKAWMRAFELGVMLVELLHGAG